MINKIVRMLNQEQGFTLMELMIVVVIIGILAGVAVPVYNGVQNRAKYAVGEANATMLNRAIRQLEELGYYDAETGEMYKIAGESFAKVDEPLLLAFLGVEEPTDDSNPIPHVKLSNDGSEYVVDLDVKYEWNFNLSVDSEDPEVPQT